MKTSVEIKRNRGKSRALKAKTAKILSSKKIKMVVHCASGDFSQVRFYFQSVGKLKTKTKTFQALTFASGSRQERLNNQGPVA